MTKASTKTNGHKPCKNSYADFLKSICALARDMQRLGERAVKEYAPVVENIICTKCHDIRLIERTLDSLLGFCFDRNALQIYKKLCRYYYRAPLKTRSYVIARSEATKQSP